MRSPSQNIARHLPSPSSRARLGLFGGSFDPPHIGHVHVAETALKRLGLDQVWWFPTPGNPLKSSPSAYDARRQDVAALTASNNAFKISAVERHAALTYSIDLIRLVQQHCPKADLVWVIGADSLMTMHYWKDWQEIAQTIPICVIARPGFERAALNSRFAKVFSSARMPARTARLLASATAPAWTYLTAPLRDISSTELRHKNKTTR